MARKWEDLRCASSVLARMEGMNESQSDQGRENLVGGGWACHQEWTDACSSISGTRDSCFLCVSPLCVLAASQPRPLCDTISSQSLSPLPGHYSSMLSASSFKISGALILETSERFPLESVLRFYDCIVHPKNYLRYG